MLTDKYKTCIVLINYNSINDTIECLESIRMISGALPFVVLVDNASKDSENIEEKVVFYPDIFVIKNTVNVGFGRANNIGIDWIYKNIICDYIFILNNDTLIDKESIGIMEKACLNSPIDVALVTPKILVNSNPKEIWYEGATINFNRITPHRTFDNNESFTEFASGCSMFFKYEALKSLGGFDPYFFMYDEDVELSLRIIKKRLRILYLPDAVIYHKCQGSQTKEKNIPSNQLHPNHPSLNFYLSNTISNRKYIIRIHLDGIIKIKATLNHTLYWVMKSFQYVLFGKIDSAILVFKYLI